MPDPLSSPQSRNYLSVRIGHWFEARGAGWGVIAVPILLLLIAILAGGRFAG